MPLDNATIRKQTIKATDKLIYLFLAHPVALRGELDMDYIMDVGKDIKKRIDSKQFQIFYGAIVEKSFNGNVDAAIYDLIGGMLDEELKHNPRYTTTILAMLHELDMLGYPYKRKPGAKFLPWLFAVIGLIVIYGLLLIISNL